jgi:polyisoprenyl-teichoic acid--peptidoglycan teichoic acid transferase
MSLAVVLSLGSAVALTYVQRNVSEVPRLGLGGVLTKTETAGEPQNILMVGIDDGTGLAAGDPVLRGRDSSLNTDTIMILRVDPTTEEAAILSLPRDLWVNIAGTARNQKINSAMSLGGPQRLIETIRTNFGIEIQHFVMVDLVGFKQLVDAVDGVPMYFPWRARDQESGFVVDAPGCVTLDPDQALAYARSRTFQIFDEDRQQWVLDPNHDLGRIERQQRFIQAALRRAIDKGVRNPFTLNQLIGVGQRSVTLDDQLTTQQIVDLGLQFRDFDPDRLVLYTAPSVSEMRGDAAAQILIDSEAQPIFDLFRGVDAADDVVPSVRVGVQNGSGIAGQGRLALDGLAEHGFVAVRSMDAPNFDYRTSVVKYAPGQELEAAHVARFLDGDPLFEEDDTLASDLNVVLVTGADFVDVRAEPRPLDDFGSFLDQVSTTVTTSDDAGSPGMPPPPPVGEEESFVPETPVGVSCG